MLRYAVISTYQSITFFDGWHGSEIPHLTGWSQLELILPLPLMISLSYKGGQDLSLHTSFTMYGCNLLIRTDNSIIINDIPSSEGWTGLIRVTRLDEDLTYSPHGAFVYLSSNDHLVSGVYKPVKGYDNVSTWQSLICLSGFFWQHQAWNIRTYIGHAMKKSSGKQVTYGIHHHDPILRWGGPKGCLIIG